jgi:hypothetical protein
MVNFIISIVASVVLLFGLVSMVTPIPGGTFLIAGSLTALICSSPFARRCLQVMRTKMNWLNKGILWVEAKVGDRIGIVGRALRQTRPLANQEDSSGSCSTD